ncbi:MAG: 3-oxoacyl-ACP reductase FabG [Gammaproteobacteria bacterium]
MSLLSGQTALVTGASRGIGAAIAAELAEKGAQFIGTATSEAGCDTIREALGEAGAAFVYDASESTAADVLAANMNEAGFVPSIVVNNAAITRDTLLMRMSEDDWSAVLNTNLDGVFRLSRSLLRPMLKARGGRIINLTSIVGVMGNAGQANYAAAKAGLIGFSKAMAREVASRGITVNAVAPGFIDTDMTRTLGDKQKEQLLGQIPMGRLGDAEDVAKCVSFLASPDAGYITGQVLHVNGGMLMP